MGVITIQDLKPGMVTAAPVKTTAGQLIIGKNTVLTEALITRMSFYNIQSVSVIDIIIFPKSSQKFFLSKISD